MKKIVVTVAALALLMMTGCDNGGNGTRVTAPPVQPAPPPPAPEPAPEPEPDEPSIPTAGVGSIKGDMDCMGGTITTNYSFGNVDEDAKDFVIEYRRNGVAEDLRYPSASTTGSRAIVKDIYYARANDDDRPAQWIVSIMYQTPASTYNLVTASIPQPVCEDDNLTARTTTFEGK